MFYECENFTGIGLGNWDVSQVYNMNGTFAGCKEFNCDLSKWDVSHVRDMGGLFARCPNFDCDLSKWDVSNVNNMINLFCECSKFTCIDVEKWDVSNVETMDRMFYHCNNLKYLNIYSLIEDIQSIEEILDVTPDEFEVCIEDESKIPNIFNILKNKVNFTRDCSENCYGNNNRIYDS